MKKLCVLAILAAVVVGLSGEAYGQRPAKKPGTGMRQLLQKGDADKDGKLTFEEASATFPKMTQERFNKLDRNGDGVVTSADAPPEPGQQFQNMLARADADKDGKVTLDEVRTVMPKMTPERFAQMDRNADGALTKEDTPPRPEGQAGKPGDIGQRLEKFGRSDTDGDGKVSLEEFMAKAGATEEAFKRLDRNADGALTPEDMKLPGGPLVPPARPQTLDPAQLDKNGDGKLSYEEATAFFPPLLREAFDRLDVNKDGFVAMDEVAKPGA